MVSIEDTEETKVLFKELKVIGNREGKSVSKLTREMWADYIKKHKEGNISFEISKWYHQADLQALPTIGEILRPERLNKLNSEDLLELARAARARSQEINAALKRRHIPKYDFDMGFGL